MGIESISGRITDSFEQLGIDSAAPKFAWIINGIGRGVKQTAYQVVVSSSESNADNNIGDWWDSGKVASGKQFDVAYNGSLLSSNKKYWWKIRVWDQDDICSPWSEKYLFITGFMNDSHWTANWIRKNTGTDPVCPVFRKEFYQDKTVTQATAYICGLGQFEFSMNGLKVGDHEYDPGWTNYGKSCQYVTFDVTGCVKKGKNVLGVVLGNGFYNAFENNGRYAKLEKSFGPKELIFELHMEFSDGTSGKIISDGSWKAYDSPITYSHLYGGEDYDARNEMPGWDQAGFNDTNWENAFVTDAPGGILTSQKQPPLKIARTYKTVSITEPSPSVYLYDLGMNFSGFFEITVRGSAGQTIKILPSENLKDDGTVDQRSMGFGEHYCIYTLGGSGTEIWRPKFYYTGFRYVQIEGGSRSEGDGKPYLVDIKGYYMHSSTRQVGNFACLDSKYNAVHQMLLQSFKSNLQSVLTDCPHREKLGWLEASYILAPSFAYNFDMQTLWSKIAGDMTEAQTPEGLIPDIAPEYTVFEEGFRDSASWGIACIAVPWHVYRIYGDAGILHRHYKTMKRYIGYLQGKAEDNILQQGLGDWAGIEDWDTGLVETAHYYYAIDILKNIASILGFAEDADEYEKLARQVKISFNNRYFDRNKLCYNPVTQTHQAMPLYFGLVPQGCERNVLQALLDDIISHGYHIQTGEIGLRYMLQSLTEYGYIDVVYKMIMNPTPPSFGYFVDIGKTSMPEYWDGSFSQQHAIMGHVEEWFYNSVAGIRMLKSCYEKIMIKPAAAGALEWAEASVETIIGTIASEWTKSSSFTLNVKIPANSTANVYIPVFDYTNAVITEGDQMLWENRSPVDRVKGIDFIKEEGKYTVWNVESGDYCFKVYNKL